MIRGKKVLFTNIMENWKLVIKGIKKEKNRKHKKSRRRITMKEKLKKEQRKTKNKQANGITLIALVITIIVLLILAGVSIAMLTGENGILTQAQNASKQTEIGEEKEQIALAYNGAVTKKQSTDITADDLNDQFNANGVDNATASGENPITVTFESGRTYTIDENGSISEPTESNIVATMKVEGERVETPPMPETNDPSNVFTHVEGTVDDGYDAFLGVKHAPGTPHALMLWIAWKPMRRRSANGR